MADSENSRTLPSIRYINLLSATERLLASMVSTERFANDSDAYDAMRRWLAWNHAHTECSRLCSVQQQLESELFRIADYRPAHAELRHEAEAADAIIAHSGAKAAEDSASAREQLLAEQLWSVSGKSVISAMAKMHCMLEQGEPVPNSAEFPWPQIRSALADLLMASTLETNAARDCESSSRSTKLA